MASSLMTLDIVFEKTDTDLSQCDGCEEVIYGNMYVGYLQYDYDTNQKRLALQYNDRDLTLCESCHDAVMK